MCHRKKYDNGSRFHYCTEYRDTAMSHRRSQQPIVPEISPTVLASLTEPHFQLNFFLLCIFWGQYLRGKKEKKKEKKKTFLFVYLSRILFYLVLLFFIYFLFFTSRINALCFEQFFFSPFQQQWWLVKLQKLISFFF